MGLQYEPRPHFLPFHMRVERWAILNTHRRAGKTVALVNDLLEKTMACELYRPQTAYMGPTYAQSKKIAWQYLKDYGEKWFAAPPSESELKITLHGPRTVYCLGADNPDSLRGMYLDGSVMDEYALFKPSVFTQVIRPALSDRRGWGVFASTPRGKNLFYDQYQRLSQPGAGYALTLKASESKLLPEEELKELRRDMDAEEYAQEYECSFDAALKGAIYAAEINQVFHEGRALPLTWDGVTPMMTAFDLGFTDATVRVHAYENALTGTLDVMDCVASTGKEVGFHIQDLENEGYTGPLYLPHDARARSLQTGKSIVELFLQEGHRPIVVPNHKVRDRLSAVRKVLPRVRFNTLSDGVNDLLEALKGYRREWDENLLMFKDSPLHDWCSDYADSFGYLCVMADKNTDAKRQKPKNDPDSEFNLYNLFADYEDRLAATSSRRIA